MIADLSKPANADERPSENKSVSRSGDLGGSAEARASVPRELQSRCLPRGFRTSRALSTVGLENAYRSRVA